MKIKTMIFMVFYFILMGINSFAQEKIIENPNSTEKSENKIYQLSDTTLAAFYFAKGDSLANLGEYDLSSFNFIEAQKIFDHLISYDYNGNIWAKIAKCSNNYSWNLISQAKTDSAILLLERTIKNEKLYLGENNLEISRSYLNLGATYYLRGDYDLALEYPLKSLNIRLSVLGDNNLLVAENYNNIGNVYKEKGEYDKALEYQNKSLNIRLKLLGGNHPLVSDSYHNIGVIYSAQNDYKKTIEYFKKSMAIRIDIFGENHPAVHNIYYHIGYCYCWDNEYDLALEYLTKALNIGLKILGKKHPEIANNYLAIAETYEHKKEYYDALKFCQKAILTLTPEFTDTSIHINPSLNQITDEFYLLNALYEKAKIFNLIGQQTGNKDLEMSLKTFKLADELVSKIRTGYKSEGSKFILDEKASEIYEGAINACLEHYNKTKDENYKQQAFYFAEKSKAAVLQEALTEVQAKQFANIPADRLELEKQLKNDLAVNETQLQTELQKIDSYDSIKVREFQNRLFDLKTNYYQLIKKFEVNYPSYYNLKYKTKTSTIEEIQNQLSTDTALLEYFIGDSTIYVFSVSKNSFNITFVKKPDDFLQLVKDFYTSVVKAETEQYISSANRLSKLIIEPIKNELSSKQNLVIIPHNELYKIPFEALLLGGAKLLPNNQIDFSTLNYLIKSFNVSYNYSASLYINNLNEQAEVRGKTDELKSFVGFAPVFSNDDTAGFTLTNNNYNDSSENSDSLLRSVVINGRKFSELKYSEWEVKSILELFSKAGQEASSIAFFHADASKDNFKNKINNFRIVHIASHSFINESQPKISGIVFAQPNDSNTVGGILYAGETYSLDLNADLVVLSSCESGLGKLIRGEGMMALTRGFLYSGASNVLFSLWKIPDKQTSEQMIDFYKQMLSGNNYSESLRKAKLKLISNPISARPRSWASFLLIGSDI